jgi:hypothetical protein
VTIPFVTDSFAISALVHISTVQMLLSDRSVRRLPKKATLARAPLRANGCAPTR